MNIKIYTLSTFFSCTKENCRKMTIIIIIIIIIVIMVMIMIVKINRFLFFYFNNNWTRQKQIWLRHQLTTLLYPGRDNKDKREVTIKIYIQLTTELHTYIPCNTLNLHTLQFLYSLYYFIGGKDNTQARKVVKMDFLMKAILTWSN